MAFIYHIYKVKILSVKNLISQKSYYADMAQSVERHLGKTWRALLKTLKNWQKQLNI